MDSQQQKDQSKITQVPEKEDNTFKQAMDGLKAPFQAHKGAPGPVVSDNMANIQQEGTKEERQARAAELNK